MARIALYRPEPDSWKKLVNAKEQTFPVPPLRALLRTWVRAGRGPLRRRFPACGHFARLFYMGARPLTSMQAWETARPERGGNGLCMAVCGGIWGWKHLHERLGRAPPERWSQIDQDYGQSAALTPALANAWASVS